ncbi:hypothetical protein, variant 2 [Aphanomyces astaci]|uniref:Uncharacterized protein n=2 Tax=Aphanomyces astaci TaxID=112090 RepID=W4GJ18_APHAT|nr:hypothetical protein, variant 2 [Aphanomyces astaci]ETV79014.1 hypothetical protein, variant 2 [Aphanomyces astaci]|eukprot:XP_009831733.1 hypothetical protein, variant 2 [Aphanomyces astaci]
MHRPTSPTHSEMERKSRELVDDGTISLTQVHASELRDMIQHVMWGLDLPCKCDDIDTLRKQFNFANDLHLETMMEFGDFVPDTLAPSSSRRLLLACKDMVGFRGMGYTFGHRFLTIDEFIATMDDIELVRVLQHHQVPVPPFVIPKQDGRHFPTSVLVSRHYMCGGRTLDQLNMVELRLECSIRNVLGAVMSKKYKKKAQLVRLLKPLFEAEHITRCAEMQQRAQMELLVASTWPTQHRTLDLGGGVRYFTTSGYVQNAAQFGQSTPSADPLASVELG